MRVSGTLFVTGDTFLFRKLGYVLAKPVGLYSSWTPATIWYEATFFILLQPGVKISRQKTVRDKKCFKKFG